MNKENKNKVFTKENAAYLFGGIIVLFVICFALLWFSEAQIPTVFTSSGIVAIISAIIGVLLTVAVTSILIGQQSKAQQELLGKQSETQKELLKHQSEKEEEKERSMKVFEKKQEVYHEFLENLKKIIQDGEFTIGVKKEDGTIDRTIDNLKDLIFQLGYLQMHTTKDTINIVLDELTTMIQYLNDYNSTQDQDKQKEMPEFYSSLSDALFTIVAELKNDLYGGEKNEPITKEKMSEILNKVGLVVETEDLNKHQLQKDFWDILRKQLKNKNKEYKIDDKDFTHDIRKYYSNPKKQSHVGYGFEFEICQLDDGTPIIFKVEIYSEYCYGFRPKDNTPNEEVLKWFDKNKMVGFRSSSGWYALQYRNDTRSNLDFWSFIPKENFDKLNNPRKREEFIAEIANEMDEYIQEFLKKAKETELINK